jgi:hypothetical protein
MARHRSGPHGPGGLPLSRHPARHRSRPRRGAPSLSRRHTIRPVSSRALGGMRRLTPATGPARSSPRAPAVARSTGPATQSRDRPLRQIESGGPTRAGPESVRPKVVRSLSCSQRMRTDGDAPWAFDCPASAAITRPVFAWRAKCQVLMPIFAPMSGQTASSVTSLRQRAKNSGS